MQKKQNQLWLSEFFFSSLWNFLSPSVLEHDSAFVRVVMTRNFFTTQILSGGAKEILFATTRRFPCRKTDQPTDAGTPKKNGQGRVMFWVHWQSCRRRRVQSTKITGYVINETAFVWIGDLAAAMMRPWEICNMCNWMLPRTCLLLTYDTCCWLFTLHWLSSVFLAVFPLFSISIYTLLSNYKTAHRPAVAFPLGVASSRRVGEERLARTRTCHWNQQSGFFLKPHLYLRRVQQNKSLADLYEPFYLRKPSAHSSSSPLVSLFQRAVELFFAIQDNAHIFKPPQHFDGSSERHRSGNYVWYVEDEPRTG